MTNSILVLVKAFLGVIGEAVSDLHKVAFFSNKMKIPSDEYYFFKTFEETQDKFSDLHKNSSEEDFNAVLCMLREIPDLKFEVVQKYDGMDSLLQLCLLFKHLFDQLRLNIFAPDAKSLFDKKASEKDFEQKYKQLQLTLKYLQKECEQLMNRKNEAVAAQISKGQSESRAYAAEDFKTQHPFFVRANAEEEIDFITQTCEEKLAHLEKVEEAAKNGLKEAALKHRKELWKIIEETVNTRIFSDWILESSKEKIKADEAELNELWKNFSEELLHCRDLCLKSKNMEGEYNQIITELREREERMQFDAAVKIQALIRGYLTRKKLVMSASLQYLLDF